MKVEKLAKEIIGGSNQALAKGITLVCSHLSSDQQQAELLLNELLPCKGNSYRIGVSGVGGVGKSTFIGTAGGFVLKENNKAKVAVLTIDPSSPKAGGSILGDGIRMGPLASHERAFVRSVANQGLSGAVSLYTYEILILLEAAGFDWVFVESVGAGQSDAGIAHLCDLFVSLQMPASGDAIQAQKKGSSELADILVIHKCDGPLKVEAEKMKAYYKQAHSLQKACGLSEFPEVLLVSSVENFGIKEFWQIVGQLKSKQKSSGSFAMRRQKQCYEVFKEQLGIIFKNKVLSEVSFLKRLHEVKARLASGQASPLCSARTFVDDVTKKYD